MTTETQQQQRRKEQARQVKWAYLFEHDSENCCPFCGKPFVAIGLEVACGSRYACETCLQELRPDLWKELSDYRQRYRGKKGLSEAELRGRGEKIQQLLGTHLEVLHARYVESQKAVVWRRNP